MILVKRKKCYKFLKKLCFLFPRLALSKSLDRPPSMFEKELYIIRNYYLEYIITPSLLVSKILFLKFCFLCLKFTRDCFLILLLITITGDSSCCEYFSSLLLENVGEYLDQLNFITTSSCYSSITPSEISNLLYFSQPFRHSPDYKILLCHEIWKAQTRLFLS